MRATLWCMHACMSVCLCQQLCIHCLLPASLSAAQGALQRILLQSDVPAAVSFVEGEIMRLLTGHVGVWELAMTGGLWRVTGQQLEKAAAAGESTHAGLAAVAVLSVRGLTSSEAAVGQDCTDHGRAFTSVWYAYASESQGR